MQKIKCFSNNTRIWANAMKFCAFSVLQVSMFYLSTSHADVHISAGMSGGWYNPTTNGQGIFLDVIPSRNQVFMGWFAYDPRDTSTGAAPLFWYTASGEYQQNVATLDLVKTSGGRFDENTDVQNELAGYVTLNFTDCLHGTMTYQLFEPALSGAFPIQRLSPDVYCQAEQTTVTALSKAYNLPPTLSHISAQLLNNGSDDQSNKQIEVRYDLADEEQDWIDVTLAAINSNGDRYNIPETHLLGHHGYPVLPFNDQWIRWQFTLDQAFMALNWSEFSIQVTADDRFVTDLQSIVDMVSEQRLIEDVANLEGVRHRSQPQGLQAARTFIKNTMANFPVTISEAPFTRQGTSGVNIIAESILPIESTEYYIIDGHYDTVANTPGADDNATGTAGMLETMRVLSQFNSEHGIKFIGFDQEELGLVGSRHHASQVSDPSKIRGLINFEMIGYTCRGEPECVNFPNADDSIYNIKSSFANTLSDAFMAVGAAHVPELKIVAVTDDGDRNFRRSDHAPFWALGVDALFIADGANFRTPHYHQPSDLLPTIDTEFMTRIVKTAVGTLAQEAGLHHTARVESDLIAINN